MKAEKEFDLIDFVRSLDKKQIPYLLIGRWAVILHGAPLMTAVYDFWIQPKFKVQVLQFLDAGGLEVPPKSQWRKPLISVFAGVDKIDFLFFEMITNREGKRIRFQECLKRSKVKEDRGRRITIRLPNIDDLIALKRVARASPEDALKDENDVHFLEAIKREAQE